MCRGQGCEDLQAPHVSAVRDDVVRQKGCAHGGLTVARVRRGTSKTVFIIERLLFHHGHREGKRWMRGMEGQYLPDGYRASSRRVGATPEILTVVVASTR